MEFSTYGELCQLVDQHGGVLSCEMRFLRDAHGSGKLGVNVVQGISEELDKLGLGHWPLELPQFQYKMARIYRKGSKVSKLYGAVYEIDEKSDEVLRNFAGGTADQTIKRIRELVCD